MVPQYSGLLRTWLIVICHFFLSLTTFFVTLTVQNKCRLFCCVVVATLEYYLVFLIARIGRYIPIFVGCYLSQLCILLYTCFFLLLLLNFHFYFLFYFQKDFLHKIPLLFCMLTINILSIFNLSQTLLGFSQTCLFFQH